MRSRSGRWRRQVGRCGECGPRPSPKSPAAGANPLKNAYATLAAAGLAADSFSPKTDLLNHTVARRLTQNEPGTAPGIPPNYPHPESLVTEDCIRP